MRTMLMLFLASCFFGLSAGADLNPLLEKSVKYDAIKVTKALSVDTLILEGDEKIVLIGLEGLRPPKFQDVKRDEHGFIIKDEDPTTALEVEALRAVGDMVNGKKVRLEFDSASRNGDGYLTAYAFLPDGKMLNEEVLRLGYAKLKLRTPNMRHADLLRKAYQEARREMRGMQGEW